MNCAVGVINGIEYGPSEPIHVMDNRIDRLQVPILLRYRDNSKDWFSVSIQGSSQGEIQRGILQLLRPTEGVGDNLFATC